MEFDEEGMNVFRQAVDDFIAAGESASFELAGRVLAAARMAVDAAEDFQDEVDELDEEGLAEVEKLSEPNLFLYQNILVCRLYNFLQENPAAFRLSGQVR